MPLLTRQRIGGALLRMQRATPRAPLAVRAACAAACGLALVACCGGALLFAPEHAEAALACVSMGAACVAMRHDEATDPHEEPPPQKQPPAADGDGDKDEADASPPESPRLRFRLVPPPALSAAAAQPFDFGGEVYSPRQDGQVVLAVAADTPAEELLDLCSHWLRVRPESLAVQGPRLTLTPGSPRRTVAQAGLGEPPAPATPPPPDESLSPDAAVPGHAVFALPWCCICLEAATGAVWSCRGNGPQQHNCCDGCARRYAATRLALRMTLPAAGALRCPAPGCPHTLLADRELWRLVNTDDVRRAHAQRVKDQAERLRRVTAGMEGAELQQRLRCGAARPCPACHALIEKAGGCNHVFCSACGTSFDWD